MINLFARLLIPHYTQTTDSTVRSRYGMLCGFIGILLNIILFGFKFFAGFISNSISITADAFNNLSDAGSSIITLVGFKLSNQRADSKHPFGHGRFEYIAGFIVSISIIIMAFELAKSSINKIIHPTPVLYSTTIVMILLVSILVKLYMASYNFSIAKKIASTSMRATALDSVSDCISTTLVLVVTVLSHLTTLPTYVNGGCGLLVACFIFYSGASSAKDTMNLLLGSPPSKELVTTIKELVLCHPEILAIHDLIVHDYGPGCLMITLHAEVDADCNILEIHDTIDNIERTLNQQLACMATIHMDPIMQHDPETQSLQYKVLEFVESIDQNLRIHDFRIVSGPTHKNLLFDVEAPYTCKLSDEELENCIKEYIANISTHYYTIICVDRRYDS
ncbi:MAG: cation diffusion facilitator family transporter [Eubacteriales bacterium]